MNTLHKKKYIKYKTKFLNLKNQIGGNNTNQLFTHGLEPTTQKFIDSLKDAEPIYELSPEEARKVLNSVATPDSKLDVDIQDIIIPNNISIRITRPKNNNSKLSPLIYVHGGGWILGNKNTHDRIVKQITINANVAVIFVNYTPAPEAKFPTQINEIIQATSYVYQNANNLNIDPNKLIVMGDSVGGNMAISICLLSKQNNIKIKQLILAYPVTSILMNTQSYEQFKNGPWLTKKAMEWFYDAYLDKNKDNKNNILISPLEGNNKDFVDFPNTLIITDENDVLRDEGEAFGHKLMNVGVQVTSVRYLGICHDFLILDALKNVSPVKNAIDLITMEINKNKKN